LSPEVDHLSVRQVFGSRPSNWSSAFTRHRPTRCTG
jgi:hypothetical protein